MKHFSMQLFCFIFLSYLLIAPIGGKPVGVMPADTAVRGQAETLSMTIYDRNGVKRLLSPKHPSVLTQGLFFMFPSDVRGCEICQNNGPWEETEARVYLDPMQTADAVMSVRFRARGGDGGLRYSRNFVLTGSSRAVDEAYKQPEGID